MWSNKSVAFLVGSSWKQSNEKRKTQIDVHIDILQ